MDKPTQLEKVAGNALVQGSLAVVAAASGMPIAALLPVLGGTLASRRHATRVSVALQDIETILDQHSERLDQLTDAQYKLLNETVLTILQTTDEEKLYYLRNAIAAGVREDDISHIESTQVARAIRDLTAAELAFLIQHWDQVLMIGPVNLSDDEHQSKYVVDRASPEMTCMSGLMGLGLVISAGSTMDDGGRFVFSPVCVRLRAIVSVA